MSRGRQFTSDLASRVARTHDQHISRRKEVRSLVLRAMDLCDLGIERLSHRRDEGSVERSGGDHDLLRLEHLCDAFATYTPLLLESEVTVVSGSIGSSNFAA